MDASTTASHDSDGGLPPAHEYLFGPFRMDVASLQLWKGDELVALTPKAFDTLLVLIRHRHRLVRKNELMTLVWANAFVSEDSLTQNITALRRALGDDHHQPEYIATITRRGYRFIAAVTERHADGRHGAAVTPPEATLNPDAPLESPAVRTQGAPSAARRPRRLAMVAAAVAIALLGTTAWMMRESSSPTAAVGVLRFTLDPPRGTRLASGGVLSPDSRQLAFVAQDEPSGVTRLWVKPLDATSSRAIEGTEGASRPFWSPDSGSIAFFANGRLKRVPAAGGPVQALASTVGLTAAGGTWGPNDVILFSEFKSGVKSVAAGGGPVTEITRLDPSVAETAHRWPQFLPDGRRFLYSVITEDAARGGTYVGGVDGEEKKRLTDDVAVTYVEPGYLLFIRDRVLLAQRFDPEQLRLTGNPMPIAGDMEVPTTNNGAVVSGSANGLLSFGGHMAGLQLAWFNRAGEQVGQIKAPTPLYNPTLSSDERYVLAGSGTDIWLADLERDTMTRVSPGNSPLLAPDGRIAFTSGRKGGIADVYVRPAFGGGAEELLIGSPENKIVNDWSRDGRYIVFASTNVNTKTDLWVMPTSGGEAPAPFLATPFNEFQAQVSPDGKSLAYASDESGAWEVYVQSFPFPGDKRVVSNGGGSEPQWRRDGRELFYLAADGTLMSVDVRPGDSPQFSRPQPLFRTRIPQGEFNARRNHYAVAADGQRFLINTTGDAQESITVIVNWAAQLESQSAEP